ncbi:MAG: hypothetical protein NT126_00370 [Bacteroidetes bacterium]|nr:hypothetical protein [Bacteroidota bacterium]
MRDFTLKIYQQLLEAAIDGGYRLTSFEKYIVEKESSSKWFILRHDVDRLPYNSLETAKLQHRLGVKGTYYFRIVRESFDPVVIEKIASLGHEIGYHYEDVALQNGNIEKAFEKFSEHLEMIRKYYPVKTVCMHGSPLSKWDNRLLWNSYQYCDLGIIGEPYFDLDFNKVLYITDTGRSWNKNEVSVRDKVNSDFQFRFNSTADVINHFKQHKLPDHIMQNIHPQRWTDDIFLWTKELFLQNLKNVVKKVIVGRSQ